MGERERRAAENEVRSRRVNRAIEEQRRGRDGEETMPALLCECARDVCTMLIKLPRSEYERVRSNPRRFFVVPDHVDPAVETAVSIHPGYVVVEKHGEAGRIAEGKRPAEA